MKTNQVMDIAIGDHNIQTYHKTGEVVLADVWRAGNAYRGAVGKPQANVTLFMDRKLTKEFIGICEKENGGRSIIRKEGRGRSSKTFVSLHFAIYAAEFLSTEFHYRVIDAFINSKILEWRDSSGDNFKLLNINIDKLPDRVAKAKEKGVPVCDCNKGCYVSVAKILKDGLKPDGGSWNTANADQLRERTKLEEKIADYIEQGFITSFEQLKEVLHRLIRGA